MKVGQLLDKAKGFSSVLSMMGLDLDLSLLKVAEISNDDQLDRALDGMDELAQAAGAEVSVMEIPIGDRTARVFIVLSPAPTTTGTLALPKGDVLSSGVEKKLLESQASTA